MAKKKKTAKKSKGLDYRSAGVDIDAGNSFVKFVFKKLKSTYSKRVVELEGGYAGLFSIANDPKKYKRNYRQPVLVACTDSVGTKVKLAFATNIHNTVGIDVVAMNVNDMLCVGAEPLFFIDYIGIGKVKGGVCERLLLGVIEGCKQSDCALLGGETAEMPDVYQKGEYDLVGFAVGAVEPNRMINAKDVKPGDAIIGLPSSGVHSNGFTLARRALFDRAGYTHRKKLKALGSKTLGEELLTPTRIYVKSITKLLRSRPRAKLVNAMAHITGGGLIENVPRVLPKGCRAKIDTSTWTKQPIFDVIQEAGGISDSEMYRVFNMGIGFVLVVPSRHKSEVMKTLRRSGEKPVEIGEIVKGKTGVELL